MLDVGGGGYTIHTNPWIPLPPHPTLKQYCLWILYAVQIKMSAWLVSRLCLSSNKCKMYVYSLISPWVHQTSYNLQPWYWNSLVYSLISSGENSAFARFAAALDNHYNLAFSFHQVPITAGWTDAAWYERFAKKSTYSVDMCYYLCGSCNWTSFASPQYTQASLVVYDMATGNATWVQ